MKIVVLHGQDHQGSTYRVTEQFLEGFAMQQPEVIEFCTNNLSSCLGCFQCIVRGEEYCPHYDEIAPIIDAIEEADIIVAQSPTYCMGMSGQLKTFFDHMAYRWLPHRPHPAMRQKAGVAISTSAGMGDNRVTKDIARNMHYWGVGKVYRIHGKVAAMGWQDVSEKVKADLFRQADTVSGDILRKIPIMKPSLKNKLLFKVMAMQQRKNTWNPIDRRHWEENGWL